VQHDCGARVYHVCLEKDFVDDAVVGDEFHFACRQVQAPVAEVLVYDVDGVVLER
jgi:hypothetical protein